jgi:hypothetical protein
MGRLVDIRTTFLAGCSIMCLRVHVNLPIHSVVERFIDQSIRFHLRGRRYLVFSTLLYVGGSQSNFGIHN